MSRIPGITVALLLVWLSLGVPAGSITLWLDPDIDLERLVMVRNGVQLLQFLLFADAVLILLLVFGGYSRLQNLRQHASGLWQPSQIPVQDSAWQPLFIPAMLFILILASALRGLSLDTDLWIDEVFTLVNFVRLPLGELVSDFTDDNQHLFLSVLSHLSVALFGESHWAVRLPAVIFGIGSIWVTMRLAALVYGYRTAVVTGLLLALSWHHIWFSQNARGYTILLFGTVLATDMLLRALRDGLWRYWVGYALIIAFSAWAHVTAVFVALAHGLVISLLLIWSGRLRRAVWLPLTGFLLAAWFTLHLYALVLPQMLEFFSRPGAGTGVTPLEWRNPLWLFNEVFERIGVPSAFGWAGMTGIMLVLTICAWWYLRREPLFVLLAGLPGVLLGITMFLLGRNLWPRMFFNEIGFIIL
ncbi:MAG: glycosyltransferase family 39 protein, partial [Gammaproteobacteria bacterium]|nr:glycosyltransferase family 39 protein [Gammaproteobacteria bacterium]